MGSGVSLAYLRLCPAMATKSTMLRQGQDVPQRVGAQSEMILDNDTDGFDLVSPRAEALMESLRATGYSLPDAIADLLDNSITAGAKNIWLTFHWAGSDSWVTTVDDGAGMTRERLINAMRMGSTSPLEERSSSDLGR